MIYRALLLSLTLPLLAACTDPVELAPVPEPPDHARPEIPPGSSSVTLRSGEDESDLVHVKGIHRTDPESGEERVMVVLTQTPVASESLSDPLEAFSTGAWATANLPTIRTILSFEVDPNDPSHLLECVLYRDEVQGKRCGSRVSTLDDIRLTASEFAADIDFQDFFRGAKPEWAWRATGRVEAPVIAIEAASRKAEPELLDEPQLARLRALLAALEDGDLAATRAHFTERVLLKDKESSQDHDDVALIQALSRQLSNEFDPASPDVHGRLYSAGKRARLELVREKEHGSTKMTVMFRWENGKWLVD